MAVFNNLKNPIRLMQSIFQNSVKSFSISSSLRLKEIQVQQEKDNLIVSGQYVQSPREQLLMKNPNNKKKFCLKCTLGLDVKHTDVLILSQYLRSDGCMLPRRITGLCKVQQKRMGKLVTMAQKAGLMPNIAPDHSKRDPKKRFGWKKYNTYFDENTIKFRGKKIE